MFSFKKYTEEQYDVYRMMDEEGRFVDIIPQLGAMVYRLKLMNSRGELYEILAQDSLEELNSNPWFRGRILFPFNDRIPEGVYNWKNQKLKMASEIHGFVFDQEFQLENQRCTPEEASLNFSYTIEKDYDPGYPFRIRLLITYQLKENDFSVHFEVQNLGNELCPFALGWHPYFRLSEKVDNWSLSFDGEYYVEVDEDLMPTGEFPPVINSNYDFRTDKSLGKNEIDIAINNSGSGLIKLHDGKNIISCFYEPSFFPFVQLFIPPDRQSIAIEPVTAATNSFNRDELGRIDLLPGECKKGKVRIKLM